MFTVKKIEIFTILCEIKHVQFSTFGPLRDLKLISQNLRLPKGLRAVVKEKQSMFSNMDN